MNPFRPVPILATALVIAALITGIAWDPISQRLWPAAPPERMVLAVSTAFIGSGLIQVAHANGFFVAEGIEATIQPHTSGRSALEAVNAGKADLATVGDTPVMFAVLRGSPIAVVTTLATVTRSHGIVARGDRGIQSPRDLKGKRVGVTVGTDSHFLLSVILAANQLPFASVKAVPLQPEELAPALATGKVDAVATWDPWLSMARTAAGEGAVSMFGESGFAFWFHLVGQKEAVTRNSAGMKKVLRALLRAERFIDEHPQEAKAIVASATRMSPAMFAESWPKYSLRLKLHQGMLTMLEDQARWAMANGYAESAPMPNFLGAVHLEPMLAIRPETVSVVH